MQKTMIDGSIDTNAFAAILSLASERAGKQEEAISEMRNLSSSWAETMDQSCSDSWDPWSADESLEQVRHIGEKWHQGAREMAPTHDWDPWHS